MTTEGLSVASTQTIQRSGVLALLSVIQRSRKGVLLLPVIFMEISAEFPTVAEEMINWILSA